MWPLVFLFSCLASKVVDAAETNDSINNVRIVGGRTASDAQFPYIVSLRFPSNQHACGGAILNENWILTAAHCVYMNLQPLSVVVGTNHLESGGFAYPIEMSFYHRDFNSHELLNDIALVKVAVPIQFNVRVRPIVLANYDAPSGSHATVSGWGKLGVNAPVSETLQYQHFQTTSQRTCWTLLYPNYIRNTQICAYSMYGQGTCQGDSGGPLVINGQLHGITSWGIECAVGRPDVYTKVFSYLGWITDVMKSN